MNKPVVIGNATLYLGDCLEILPTLGKVDAVITDPPYGIDFEYSGAFVDTRDNLRELIASFVPWSLENASRTAVLCGISQTHLYPEPAWIACVTWKTTGSFGKYGYTQWMPVLLYGEDVKGLGNVEGRVTKSDVLAMGGGDVGVARKEVIDHPCPKSTGIMEWTVARFSKTGDTILDPFLGGGSTGIAALKLGRKFIGIELEPKYFDIACRRIEDAQRQAPLIPHEPPQKAEQLCIE
jgi:site-specific DNA-methyltransferase (adenine-specific)